MAASRLTRALGLLAVLVTLPPTLAHEATHAAASRPFAERCRVARPLSTRPSCQVWWREATPGWAVALAALAPLLVGIVVGVAALAWIVASGSLGSAMPQTARQWLVCAMGATYYGIYAAPSPSDIRTALDARQ